MKIVKATGVPTEILFEYRAVTLGNQRGPFAVVDDDMEEVYVLGDRSDCEAYIALNKQTDPPTENE